MLRSEELQKHARATLKNPSATDADKEAAKQAIARITAQKATKAEIDSFGKKPTRKNFTNEEEYRAALTAHLNSKWEALDRRAIRKQAEQILNDKNSSPLSRHNARARLQTLDGPPLQPENDPDEKKASSDAPRREDFGWSGRGGEDWDDFLTSGGEDRFQAALDTWRTNAPPPTDQVAAFLNGLNEKSFDVPAGPIPQNVTPKTPIAPPIEPAPFCEQCRVPFTVCGCNKVMCSLCLHPQSNCFPPCQNARRATINF